MDSSKQFMFKPGPILLVLVIAGAVSGILLWSRLELRKQVPQAGQPSVPASMNEPKPAAVNPLIAAPAFAGDTQESMAKQITLLEGQVEYLQGQVKALQDENAELIERLGTLGLKNAPTEMRDRPATPPLTEGGAEPDYVSLGVELMSLRQLRQAPIPTVQAPEAEVERLILGWLKKRFSSDEPQRRVRGLAALGAIPQPVDILPLQAALMARQLGGWYDDEKETLLVTEPPSNAAQPQPDPVMALAYGELLRDHGQKLLPEPNRLSTDARLAREALIGGDAALIRFLYSLKKPIPVNPNDLPPEDPDHPFNQVPLPVFLRELQMFPFSRGFEFAQSLHSAGDFKQLDAAYSRPPATTAEVIDPETYLSQNPPPPVKIDWADRSVQSSAPYWDDALGQFAVYVMLKAYNPDEVAFDATKRWVADRCLAWTAAGKSRDHAVWQTMWAGEADARLFFKAMREVLLQRYDQPSDSPVESPVIEFSAQDRFVRLSINCHGYGVLLIDAATSDFASAARDQFER